MAGRIVDVSAWPPAGEEQVGTKPKQWLFEDDTAGRWLWKAVTSGTDKTGKSFLKGDDWAEYLASLLASEMGVACAHVEMAVRDGEPGIVAANFAPKGTDLVLGNELLSVVADDYSPTGERFDPRYTLDRVQALLSAVDGPAGEPAPVAWETFVGYLVLDGWIGNTDRHHQNWGVLVDAEGRQRLAPTFDHASSLGFLLPDEDRLGRLASTDPAFSVESWADRAKTPFAGRPHPCDLAATALATISDVAARDLLRRLDAALARADDLIGEVPGNRMTEASASFAGRLLRRNGARILSHPLRKVEA